MNTNFETLSKAISGMKEQGYTQDFNLQENCLACRALGFEVNPEDFEVDHVFRFEGASNPDDSSVLYAISAAKHDIKGILIDAYGAYSGQISPELLKKLRYNPLEPS